MYHYLYISNKFIYYDFDYLFYSITIISSSSFIIIIIIIIIYNY